MRFDDLYAAEQVDRDDEAETRTDIIRFRSEMGLPADSALVEYFLAECKAGRQEPGMWLTPSEWVRYEEKDRLQEQACERLNPYIERHPESFAGLWLGAGLQAEYNVAFTADLDSHREAMLRLYPHAEVVHVHQAEYTNAELEAISERIADDVDELSARGISWKSVGLDVKANRVEVDVVSPDADAAQATLRALYGPRVACTWLGAENTEVIPVVWLRWTIDPAGRALTVHYLTNATYEFERVTADEGKREIRVCVFERSPVGPVILPMAAREATVHLEEPLGNRRVIDGATGRERDRR